MAKTFTSVSDSIILCSLPINENLFAVGCKDGSLTFYDQRGKVVKNSRDHKSSICTLALINNNSFLVSGGDHPHSEIYLWDIRSL